MTAPTFGGRERPDLQPRPDAPDVYEDANGNGPYVPDHVAEQWEQRRHDDAATTRPAPAPAASTWTPVDLAPFVAAIQAGEDVGPRPTLLPRTDGPCLLYPGELHSIAAEPESGKSWIMLAESARLISEGEDVLCIDFEDSPGNLASRLVALGATGPAIVDHFTLVRPETALHADTLATLLDGRRYTLAVIDGVTEAMGLLGLEIGSNDDVARFRKMLARPIAATGAAVVEIDHVVKNAENRGRFALGGGHKLAGVAVAYSLHAIERPSRARPGLLKLTVEKDRHGRIREHEDTSRVIALVRITPNDSTVTVTVDQPDGIGADGVKRPTVLMARVGDFIEANPGATRNQIKDGVKGNTAKKDEALAWLIEGEFVDRKEDGNAFRHYHLKPFAEESGTTGTNQSPTGTRNHPGTHRYPVPTPFKGTGSGDRSNPGEPTGSPVPRPANALTADLYDEAA